MSLQTNGPNKVHTLLSSYDDYESGDLTPEESKKLDDLAASLTNKDLLETVDEAEVIGKISKIPNIDNLLAEVFEGILELQLDLEEAQKAVSESPASYQEPRVLAILQEIEMLRNREAVLKAAMNHNDTESTSRRYHNADNEETLTEDFQSYTIQSGDTLGKIASKYGINWKELYQQNRATIGNDPGKIMVGDRLIIPNNGSEQEQYEEQREREAESARTVSQKPSEQTNKELSGEKLPFSKILSLGVEYSEDRVTQCSKTARLNGRTFGVDLPRGHARDAVSRAPIDESFVRSLKPHDTFNAIENQLNSLKKKSGVNFCDVDVESYTENGKIWGHRVVMFTPDNIDYRYVLDPYKQNHLGRTKPKLAQDYFGSHKLNKINTYKADKRVIV